MAKKETKSKSENSVQHDMKKLAEIVSWFEDQSEVDVEKALEKVKEGAKLVKASKARLKEIENEFESIKKDLV